MRPDIRSVVDRLRAGVRAVALTGSGVSAESGIDCFRDPNGIWAKLGSPIVSGGVLEALVLRPVEASEFLRQLAAKLIAAVPNPAHIALSGLEASRVLATIVTQNVDGLHQKAGSTKVIEMHGSLLRKRCDRCNAVAEVSVNELSVHLNEMAEKLSSFFVTAPAQLLERCDCGGLLHADVVEFGQNVHDLQAARTAIAECDVLIVVGTSGLVDPAASLPAEAKAAGAFIVEIDPEVTQLSDIADVVIRDSASLALAEIEGGLSAAAV